MTANFFISNGNKFLLYDWQQDAKSKWEQKKCGIVQATTGSGKSRVAHAVIVEWLKNPNGVVTVVVPQIGLATQWRIQLEEILGIEVGQVQGSKKVWNSRINVIVINTAAKLLPAKDYSNKNHLIVADECHRMAAPTFARCFTADHDATLGLSATPEREDTGLDVVSELLGEVIYTYGYEEALKARVISDFEVRAVQIPLTAFEQKKHDDAHNAIISLSRSLNARYGGGNLIATCQKLLARGTDDTSVGGFLKAIRERKEILNGARNRFAALDLLMHKHKSNKKMVFHESLEDLDRLEGRYSHLNPLVYHSKKTAKNRRESLAKFSASSQGLLLSCRALVEGIDIPDADVGVMVSGTRSVRSRIQTIGRLLRKGGKEQPKIYLFYVPKTSDEKAITNLIAKGFPKDKLAFYCYDATTQSITPTTVNLNSLKSNYQPRNYSPQHCKNCDRTFKSVVGLNNHHCVPLEDMSWEQFMSGFKKD